MIAFKAELYHTDSPFQWTLKLNTTFGCKYYLWDPKSDQNIDVWIAEKITDALRAIPEQTKENFLRWVSKDTGNQLKWNETVKEK